MSKAPKSLDLAELCQSIQHIDLQVKASANRAINIHVTLRNWLVGAYIVQYELNGKDRAQYGEGTIQAVADRLNSKGFSKRNLNLYRHFCKTYPQLGQCIAQFMPKEIRQSVIAQLAVSHLAEEVTGTAKQNKTFEIGQSMTAQSDHLQLPAEKLLKNINFTHFSHLITIDDPTKRLFYEIECIKGTWTVRELRRQISSLYYERSGMSMRPELLSERVQDKAETLSSASIVKDVYAFEFLGLPAHLAVEEDELETALIEHLQSFILEMGYGFCLEGRQKRVLIGDEYFFVDLVFYHRILKCHVLVELKVGEFSHENAGQLNAYLNYYKKEVMEAGDNVPVGILLVTGKNEALVQYATAGMDEQLFVKEYMVNLPDKRVLEEFLLKEMAGVGV